MFCHFKFSCILPFHVQIYKCYNRHCTFHRLKGFSDFLISFKTSAGCKKIPSFSDEHVMHDFAKDRSGANIAVAALLEALKVSSTSTPAPSTFRVTESPVPSSHNILPSLFVNITSLIVLEGDHAIITNKQLKVERHPNQPMTDDSDIMVLVTRLPSHGRLTMQMSCVVGPDLSKFNMAELIMNEIWYCHDGSETESDEIDLMFIWNTSKGLSGNVQKFMSNLPEHVDYLRKSIPLNNGTVYSLPIAIKPTNDPPVLNIPLDYIFHPIKDTITHLPVDVLKAVDPDSSSVHIVYNILGNVDSTFIAYETNPKALVNSFTQEDVDRNRMIFVHTGNVDNTRLVLRVTNSPDELISSPAISPVSSTAVLRIAAVPLNIKGINIF